MSMKRDPKKEQNETAKAFASAILIYIAVTLDDVDKINEIYDILYK